MWDRGLSYHGGHFSRSLSCIFWSSTRELCWNCYGNYVFRVWILAWFVQVNDRNSHICEWKASMLLIFKYLLIIKFNIIWYTIQCFTGWWSHFWLWKRISWSYQGWCSKTFTSWGCTSIGKWKRNQPHGACVHFPSDYFPVSSFHS